MDPDLMKDYLLTEFPNPERKGCPDEETTKALAERRLSLKDPAMLHIASCSECYAEYRNYRLDMEERGELDVVPSSSKLSKWVVPFAIAASLICGVAGIGIHKNIEKAKAGASLTASLVSSNPVSVNIDLLNAVTTRGGSDEAKELQEVTLPAATVNLAVTLPHFSQRGSYIILVTKDRAGKQVVAQGNGMASESQGKVGLHVTLDLRKATPGAYFLATIRGSDNGTYYYPLKVD